MVGREAIPKRLLSTRDGVVLIVGLVLGAGIFRAPQLVAAGSSSGDMFLALWVFGGVASFIGALCYAELASSYPSPGGEYHFLSRSFGQPIGFLCAWSRLTVIQTGSIAILAFLVGDYAAAILGSTSPPWTSAAVAATVVVLFTIMNVGGLRRGCRMQYALTTLEVLALLAVIAVGLGPTLTGLPSAQTVTGAPAATSSGVALAAVFVLLTFGGWSEAAYLSAELRDRHRGVVRTLSWGLGIITVMYLLANLAYLERLGLGGIASSPAVAADVMRQSLGGWGATAVSLGIIVAALSSMNATMITGARSNYALGRDVSLLPGLGTWDDRQATPKAAFLVQGLIALGLVAFGTLTRGGFEAMVAYTAPVFWLILLGSGISLFVLRRREPAVAKPFRVPLYPLTPLVFCAIAAYMLHASVAYAGRGALLGIAVMLAGIPVLAVSQAQRLASTAPQSGVFRDSP